jgi:hypothetical protein
LFGTDGTRHDGQRKDEYIDERKDNFQGVCKGIRCVVYHEYTTPDGFGVRW